MLATPVPVFLLLHVHETDPPLLVGVRSMMNPASFECASAKGAVPVRPFPNWTVTMPVFAVLTEATYLPLIEFATSNPKTVLHSAAVTPAVTQSPPVGKLPFVLRYSAIAILAPDARDRASLACARAV